MLETLATVAWTALVTAAFCLLCPLVLAPRRPPAINSNDENRHQARDTDSYDKTFRAQGIPSAYFRSSTKLLLQSILGLENESSQLEVHSLAPSPYESNIKASK